MPYSEPLGGETIGESGRSDALRYGHVGRSWWEGASREHAAAGNAWEQASRSEGSAACSGVPGREVESRGTLLNSAAHGIYAVNGIHEERV